MVVDYLTVASAQLMAPLTLAITFSDGEKRTLDFAPFLRRSWQPAVRECLDPARFAAHIVRDGELMWGNYDFTFPVVDLYHGNIFQKRL